MTETTIESLPNEVLHKIFHYVHPLQFRGPYTINRVSKLWNFLLNILESSKEIEFDSLLRDCRNHPSLVLLIFSGRYPLKEAMGHFTFGQILALAACHPVLRKELPPVFNTFFKDTSAFSTMQFNLLDAASYNLCLAKKGLEYFKKNETYLILGIHSEEIASLLLNSSININSRNLDLPESTSYPIFNQIFSNKNFMDYFEDLNTSIEAFVRFYHNNEIATKLFDEVEKRGKIHLEQKINLLLKIASDYPHLAEKLINNYSLVPWQMLCLGEKNIDIANMILRKNPDFLRNFAFRHLSLARQYLAEVYDSSKRLQNLEFCAMHLELAKEYINDKTFMDHLSSHSLGTFFIKQPKLMKDHLHLLNRLEKPDLARVFLMSDFQISKAVFPFLVTDMESNWLFQYMNKDIGSLYKVLNDDTLYEKLNSAEEIEPYRQRLNVIIKLCDLAFSLQQQPLKQSRKRKPDLDLFFILSDDAGDMKGGHLLRKRRQKP